MPAARIDAASAGTLASPLLPGFVLKLEDLFPARPTR
jgi:hypothetical protein